MDWDEVIEEAKFDLGYSKGEYIEDWNEVVEEAKSILELQREHEKEDMSISMKNLHTDYLKSERWKTLRELKLYNSRKICEKCSEEATQVHHSNYNFIFTPKESAGHVSQEQVKRYIQEQEGKDIFEYDIYNCPNELKGQLKIGDFGGS